MGSEDRGVSVGSEDRGVSVGSEDRGVRVGGEEGMKITSTEEEGDERW